MSKQKQKTICVHHMFWERSELAIFMYWTGNWIKNLLSYCGLVDAKIRASDINLPVILPPIQSCLKSFGGLFKDYVRKSSVMNFDT